MSEEWRNVPSCPGWMASSLGRVWRPRHQQKMPNGGFKWVEAKKTSGHINSMKKPPSKRRHQVTAHPKTMPVHLMVCEAFHGPRPSNKHVCMHLDENGLNNKPDNLRWGTPSENSRAPKLIEWRRNKMKSVVGEAVSTSKLTERDVSEIRNSNMNNRVLSELYGVSVSNISMVRRKVTWRHLP